MKVVARIEKLDGDHYAYNGIIYDSFITARRAMVQMTRQRRVKRGEPALGQVARAHSSGA